MYATVIVFAVLLGVAESTVSCNSCTQNNANDCTGNTCQGNYCLYEHSVDQNGYSFVKRSCTSNSFFQYPDRTMSQTVNQCERKTVNGVSYAVEICNSGSFCDTQCNSVSSLYSKLSLALVPLMVLRKF